MKERRGLFEMIFGALRRQPRTSTQLRMLSGYTPTFTSFGQDAYASDVVRSAVHAIASNVAKLKPKHIRRKDGEIVEQSSPLEPYLQVRPNEFMNAYDFYYKVATQLLLKNNAFIFVMNNGVNITGFYPVNASSVDLLETTDGEVYAKFSFMGGKEATLPYSEIIHLRRFFYQNDMYGEPNEQALLPTLELINTTDQGIINAVKSSANIRGILKFTKAMLSPGDIKAERDRFVSEYMGINNAGGIAALDAKADYIDLKSNPRLINGQQMKQIEEKVYKYFGVNENIIMSKYNEPEWNAFYENVIEPIALQMSLEFTSKIFTERERGHGNEIIFEANRIQYASMSTKLALVAMVDRGAMLPNEWREALNLSPIEGGDVPIRRLDTAEIDAGPKAGEGGEEDDDNQNSNTDNPEGDSDSGDQGD